MDSLLDTMTNVVGILVILLVVTQLGVRSAVSRIRSNLPEVSAEQLQEAGRESESALRESEALQQKWAAQEPEFKTNNNLLVILDKRVDPAVKSKAGDAQAALESLNQKIAQSHKKESELQAELEKTRAEIELVKKDLAESQQQEAPPAKIVRIPNPRPAPANAKGEWFVCLQGRVMFVDLDAIAAAAARRIAMMKMQLKHGQTGLISTSANKKSGQPEVFEYDAGKVISYFKNNKIIIDGQRVTVYNRNYQNACWLTLNLDTKQGEDAVELSRAWSKYIKALNAVKRGDNYVRFIVFPDSFEVYLKAREIADSLQVPAGWQINTVPEVMTWTVLPDIRLHRTEEPPPPPPKPAEPVKPVAVKPKNVLD